MSLHYTRYAHNAFSKVNPGTTARRQTIAATRQTIATPHQTTSTITTQAGGHHYLQITNSQTNITGDGHAEILVAPPTASAGVTRATLKNSTPNLVMLQMDQGLEVYMPAQITVTLINNGTAWMLDSAYANGIVVM